MKRAYTIGASLTSEEYKQIKQYLHNKFMSEDIKMSMSDFVRDSIFKNMNDNKQNESNPPTEIPTETVSEPSKGLFDDVDF